METWRKLASNMYGMWKKHDKNMKKHIFKTTKISNPRNKKNIYTNRNIAFKNHIGIIPLYNSFKPQPLGTTRCSLGWKPSYET
jgi:hypothetical protein